jgi:hypothetical protein
MYAVHRLAHLIAEASDQPVYYYEFSYQGPLSNVIFSDTKKPFGRIKYIYLLHNNKINNNNNNNNNNKK